MMTVRFLTAIFGLSILFASPANADDIDTYCKSEARISAKAVAAYVMAYSQNRNENRRNREVILDKSLVEIKEIWGFSSRLVGQMLESVQNSIDGADDLMVERGYRRFEVEEAIGVAKIYQNSSYRDCLQRAAKIR